jgi:hypothetical protein
MRNMTRVCPLAISLLILIMGATALAQNAQNAQKCSQLNSGSQDWRGNLDWCIRNTEAGGSTNCPQDYPYPECVAYGGRACLMTKAIQSAKDNDYANSYNLALVCQCHNGDARDGFVYCAGQKAIGDYLKTK